MSRQKKISESNPRTGALPSEQTANNQSSGNNQDNFGMLESDKLIYQLVEQNVALAGEQFSENLRFNSETLTNVLYDNLYKLISNNVEEDDFVNWVADELVKRGCVIRTNEGDQESKSDKVEGEDQGEVLEQEEQIVYELDAAEHDSFIQKIYAAVELIKANKVVIFKLVSDVDGDIKNLSDVRESTFQINSILLKRRDDEIKSLVAKIKGNDETISTFWDKRNTEKTKLLNGLDQVKKVVEESNSRRTNLIASKQNHIDEILNILKQTSPIDEKQQIVEEKQKDVEDIQQIPSQEIVVAKEGEERKETTSIEKPSNTTQTIDTQLISNNQQVVDNQLKTQVDGNKQIVEIQKNQSEVVEQSNVGKPMVVAEHPEPTNNIIDNDQSYEKTIGQKLEHQLKTNESYLYDKSEQNEPVKPTEQTDSKLSTSKIENIFSYIKNRLTSNQKEQKDMNQFITSFPLKQLEKNLEVEEKKKKTILGKFKQKDKIKNSAMGKAVRKVFSIAQAGVRIAVKTVKKTANIVKGTAKKFVKTSHFIGKSLAGAGSRVVKFVKSTKESKGQNIMAALNSSPAYALTKFGIKIGWRAVKYIGKAIWRGIKKLALGVASIFAPLFRIGKNFVNSVAYYASKIGKWIKDRAYRFIIKPVSSIVSTAFGFAMSMVTSPIQFMKQMLTSIFDRIGNMLTNIKQKTKQVVKATWSIFKRILFNPLTIALIIGALFLFIIPLVRKFLSGGISGIKNRIVPIIKSIASAVWGFLKAVGTIIATVGTYLFKIVEWLTRPSGPIAKTIMFIFGVLKTIKKGIYKMLGTSGKSSVDTLCMFLAGDYIGLALRFLIASIPRLWKWLKSTKLFQFYMNVIKFIMALATWHITLIKNLDKAISKFSIRHPIESMKRIGAAVISPITSVGKAIANLFSFKEFALDDPKEENVKVASETSISIRSLKMSGMNSEKVLNKLDALGSMEGMAAGSSFLKRLEAVNQRYQQNSEQVKEYSNFILDAWELGKGNPEMASKTLIAMLDSPEISQRLMSAFFYYNPQTGQVMTLRPQPYIKQFLENIRGMLNQDDVDWLKAFKTVIEAFDQLNTERSLIVNKQGQSIMDFANRISQFNLKDPNANENLKQLAKDFNSGAMFKSIDVKSSLKQINDGEAKTRDIESVTGSSLGTNKLLEIEPISSPPKIGSAMDKAVDMDKDSSYVVKIPAKSETKEKITLPPSMTPPRPKDKVYENGKSMRDLYSEWMAKRHELLKKGITQKDLLDQGYGMMTFEEFKAKQTKVHPPTDKETQEQKAYKEKRMQALKLSKDIEAYHNQGSEANVDGFEMGEKPSILKIPTDNLVQRMLIYSPEWRRVQGAAKVTYEQLGIELSVEEKAEQEKIRKAKEAEEAKKAAEEKERRREQEILDYSAKVEGGFIEVKVGEDVTAMKDAWELHMTKRREALARGITSEDLIKQGLIMYTWEEWKVHYRKMHGLPENGIKRIPFEGKRKERNIDWSPRKALSSEELSKYGIQVSEDGPVMIPLDKALEVTNSLIQGAKTVYSIRDGLEVMKEGLDNGTKELKTRREGGIPVGVVQGASNSAETIESVQSSPQQEFESRF